MRTSRWLLCMALALPLLSRGQGTGFSYQGRLLDNGQPANGIYDLQMALMDAPTNGNQLGPLFNDPSTAVSNGLFNLRLDFGDGVFSGAARWLQTAVRTNGSAGPFTLLFPRQRLTQTPYATWARTASSATLASNLTAAALIQGNGAGLSNLNGASIAAGTITSNQIDALTWRLMTSTPTNLLNLGRGFLTPYDCGAVGDGVTDDTVAWQTFLNNASQSNLIAFVPPAIGRYYKITDTLRVTNLNGLKLIGAGGQFHYNEYFYEDYRVSRAQIRQFTPGKSGIVVTDTWFNALTDSIHIEGIVITHAVRQNWTNQNSYGLAFDGNGSDTDCNVIQSCGIFGFGAGLQLTSSADLSVISCSLGGNADGVYCGWSPAHPIPILNSLKLQTCQLSYNYSNQVHVTDGQLSLDTCDIASVSTSSRGVLITRGKAHIFNCNFEHHGTTEPAILVTSPNRSSILVLEQGQVANFGNGTPYSIVATNSNLVLNDPVLACMDANGVAVFLVNPFELEPHAILSRPGPRIRFLGLNGEQSTNTWGHFMRMVTHGPPAQLREPGALVVGQRTGGFEQSDLWFIARMAAYGGTGNPEAVSLIQYQKDKATAATFNSVTSTNGYRIGALTWTSGAGSPEGIISAPVGSLYSRSDGGPGSTLYVKETGTGNTGWVAK